MGKKKIMAALLAFCMVATMFTGCEKAASYDDVRKEVEKDLKKELKKELSDEIEEELRDSLTEEIEGQLRDQITEEVSAEYKADFEAQVEEAANGLRDSIEVARSLGIPLTKTRICGGGAKSPLWRKMITNIMNMEVERITSEEGPGLGGAMLAAVGCGEYASVEEAAKAIVKVLDVEKPDPELVAKYEEKYQQFKAIYPACKPVFDLIK